MEFPLKDYIKNISALLQTQKRSFYRHNSQYVEAGKLEKERQVAEDFEKSDAINNSENKLGVLLAQHPGVRNTAVDIGSGTGWYAKKLSQQFGRVIAIEPSVAAINIAQQFYPEKQFPNILWMEGFAENILCKLHFQLPVLFFSGVVLSHLRDREVKQICQAVTLCAPKGSLLSFSECWGMEYHQLMWHIRTKEWWQEQLPGWELNFHGPQVQNIPGRHKGFHGVKVH